MTFPPFFSSLYFPFKSPRNPQNTRKKKWNETPWPRLLRAKVIRISERCFSTKPNALFNNRIEIENLEKNSITTMTATYIDCFLKIQLKGKEKRRKNPTQQPILCMKYGWWNDKFWFLFTYICSYSYYIIINTFQFFSPPLLLSSSLLLSSVIFVADFCLLLSNNADSKTFGTRNNLGNTKQNSRNNYCYCHT